MTRSRRSVAAIEELVSQAGKTKRAVAAARSRPGVSRRAEGEGRRPAEGRARHQEASEVRELRAGQGDQGRAEEGAARGRCRSKQEALASTTKLLREKIFREQVLKDRIRPDHRAFDEIREITIEIGVLPRVHGSALFTRGETQALVTATLGTTDDAQRLESYEGEQKRRFMLHYNFPPFSRWRSWPHDRRRPSRDRPRRAWRERAIEAVLPGEDESPYTLRVVSDILESNGSSSMATVCGASLALMQAGIPLKAPVAGVAMGLVKEGDNYAILTDIAGAEDHYGDMDFKVAGTRKGITALQMDIKIMGVTPQIMREALEQARSGRLFLLDTMDAVISARQRRRSRSSLRASTPCRFRRTRSAT